MAYSTSTLAAGCFGKIYREKYNDTWAAIKKVPQHLIKRRDLERECQVYNKAIHPNIVKLLGNPTLKDSKWIIPMEFIFGEELETTIFKSQQSQIQLTPSIKATIITGMCEGLLYLHSKDIVHQDLKPDNIMVEHDTHRAVIIDMGLAKFFCNGLNSAMDMGNEAYSPPEVLQRRGQRDQRSDVWAMGKIIAELCARVRLHTPSVCPTKIQETLSLQGQQYCNAVCRMVQRDPTMRATMAGIMPEIQRAGVDGGGGSTGRQKRGHLLTPFPHTQVKNALPRPQAPVQRSPSPSRFERSALPMPEVKTVVPAPVQAPSPSRWEHAALPKTELKFEVKTALRPQPAQQTLSLSRWERAALPKTEVKNSPSPLSKVDEGNALFPSGITQPSQDVMKQLLYKEASRGLPCPLPATGKVRIRRYEQRNGEVETWEQKEVVTEGGRIVKFEDVMFNNKT
ncbi:serine/threonine-protein kinase Nek8-like [Oncorhynchus nerka]|uniref:serine/threonine-protein kinase Nek8-like n=1 Tax=Oncorhynchus nerka TaxID=8023 RepID=UPI00112FD583|nr:serine/threonine-protein kinase Nek8-like [Oncorhynchus nerka]